METNNNINKLYEDSNDIDSYNNLIESTANSRYEGKETYDLSEVSSILRDILIDYDLKDKDDEVIKYLNEELDKMGETTLKDGTINLAKLQQASNAAMKRLAKSNGF